MIGAARPTREDETVQTKLKRASERCRRVSQQCSSSRGLRRPTPGPTEIIDPRRLERVQPAPRVEEEIADPISRLIALVLGPNRD